MRHVKFAVPSPEVAEKYLRVWHSGDLFHRPETFPRISSPGLFSNDYPLEIEFGSNTGEYLCALAKANPDSNYVGVEISLKPAYVAVNLAASLGLDNILFVKAPAQDVYRLVPDGALSAAHMLFPDPALHPKFRKRRLFGPAFLDVMHRALVPGGTITLVTDKGEVLAYGLETVSADSRFERLHEEPYLLGFDPPTKTRYQRYWERHGGAIYRVELVRTSGTPQTSRVGGID
jgi:tRNA (guanine-N7-)-methyltransferase